MTDNLSCILYGKNDIRLEQRPIPKAGPNQLLIRVKTVGICGSDVHYCLHGAIGNFIVKEPMVLGHESAGIVEAVGENVRGFSVGDRVAMEPGIPCRGCQHCKIGSYNLCPDMRFFATPPVDGSLARYVTHDADFCFKLPENVSLEEGALCEPLSVAIHACRRAHIQIGQNVLITGAGPIGLLCLLTAKAMGVSSVVVTDLDDGRLALAKKAGADHIVNVRGKSQDDLRREVTSAFGGLMPDAAMECTGAQPCVETAITLTKSGGIVVLIGLGASRIEIPIIEASTREVDIRGIFRYANCYPTALQMIASGKLNLLRDLTTADYQLEDAVKAFERAQKADVIKVFIHC
ncbi:hypothetical protein WR25_22209 [Diploscapter pachys]|uniref:Sorbitol dehydrogenase n=1 Tax=Diploscapter pachys TaxID=2018661 RepID=A0A2A2KXP6_9BILA|nr:hypothetical protein WR25_22209 [Diploscapter pachys]